VIAHDWLTISPLGTCAKLFVVYNLYKSLSYELLPTSLAWRGYQGNVQRWRLNISLNGAFHKDLLKIKGLQVLPTLQAMPEQLLDSL
jgi:hypothetical protein